MKPVADVLVVGGGIVGASCAAALAARGCRVRVLDAGLPGASAAGMGHLVVMDDDPAELTLSARSLALWRELVPQLPSAADYRNCGTLWLARDAAELDLIEQKRARLDAQGIANQPLNAAATAAAEPALTALAGSLQVSGDGLLYAPVVAAWLLQRSPLIEFQRARVTAVEGSRVRLDDGRWLAADAVVLAAGLQAASLCPELPLVPKKGHLLITDRYPEQVRHQLVEIGYGASAHASSGASVAFNVQPRPTGQLLIGSSRQFERPDMAVEPAVVGQLLRRALDFLPGLAHTSLIRGWTGQRAASPDGLPLIGAHPDQPGLWLAVGHEGLGVTTAPATAEALVASLFGEQPGFHVEPFAPGRFATPSRSQAC